MGKQRDSKNLSSIEAKIKNEDSVEEEASPVKEEPKKDLFKGKFMNQFAVKKAERPPMPSNVLADL